MSRPSALRERLAYLTFPLLMGGFVALTAWGLGRGIDPARLGAALTLANFFVILGVEQLLPRNPQMNVFRDRQSINDAGHGLLLPVLARPAGGAISIFVVARLAELRAAGDVAVLWPGDWPFALQLAQIAFPLRAQRVPVGAPQSESATRAA